MLGLLCIASNLFIHAQCDDGEVEVNIDVLTDDYGYELYWDLTPAGNNCGVGSIVSGGNTDVGCNGGAKQIRSENGYGANQILTQGPFCLTQGAAYTIHSIDDWGDGGSGYIVKVGIDLPLYEYISKGSDEDFIFTAIPPPALEVEFLQIVTASYRYAGDISIQGKVRNIGTTVIRSLDLVYTINGGDEVTETLTDLTILPFETEVITHSTLWKIYEAGDYDLHLEVKNINDGGTEADIVNNESDLTVHIKASIPNILESYTSTKSNIEQKVIANTNNEVEEPQDLDFHPDTKELWVINKGTENTGGSTVTIWNPDEADQTTEWLRDGNAWHFMSLPSGIAFSDNENFATSNAIYDANHDGGEPFTGPTLWSSHPLIYAKPSGGNGSHLDMLHATPNGMGIAHKEDNAFFIFDGNTGDIVLYDFKQDHGPGNADHSDGEIYRYSDVAVTRNTDMTPSHMVYQTTTDWLYVVDGGSNKVIRVKASTGAQGGTPSYGPYEVTHVYTNITGSTQEVVVEDGLDSPTGIDIIGSTLVLSEYGTGKILFYDVKTIPATKLGEYDTGNEGVTGLVIGPNGRIWYTNALTNEVVKLEPEAIIESEVEELHLSSFEIYPNPASNYLMFDFDFQIDDFIIISILGEQIHLDYTSNFVDVSSLDQGLYQVLIISKGYSINKTFIKL